MLKGLGEVSSSIWLEKLIEATKMANQQMLSEGKRWEAAVLKDRYDQANCIDKALQAYSAVMDEDENLGKANLVSLAQTALEHMHWFDNNFIDGKVDGLLALQRVAVKLNDSDAYGVLAMYVADQALDYCTFEGAIEMYKVALELADCSSADAAQYVRDSVALDISITRFKPDKRALMDLLEQH